MTTEFRAANESAWALLFTELGQGWKYEALEDSMARALRYQPDFWLTDVLAWVEIKSQPPTLGEMRVARELHQLDDKPVYILDGWPLRGRFGLWFVTRAGEVAVARGWEFLPLCQLFDCMPTALEEAMASVKRRYIDDG